MASAYSSSHQQQQHQQSTGHHHSTSQFSDETELLINAAEQDAATAAAANKFGVSSPDVATPVTSHSLLRLFNATSARRVAVALVAVFVVYHGAMRLAFGADTCDWLLTRGELHGDDVWQPYGCMIHTYSQADSRRCLRYLHYLKQPANIAFVGDSRVRQLYVAFVALCGGGETPLNSDKTGAADTAPALRHRDLNYSDPQLGVRVRFLWRPRVDATMVAPLIEWRDSVVAGVGGGSSDPAPTLLVIGSAAHAIKAANGSLAALAAYRHNVSRVGAVLQQLASPRAPHHRPASAGSYVLWLQQPPVFYDRLAEYRRAITNRQLQLFNAAARQALQLAAPAVRVWESHRLIGGALLGDSGDGLHAGARALRHSAQLLANIVCNEPMNYSDGTCCRRPDRPQPLQLLTAGVLAAALVASLLLKAGGWLWRARARAAPAPAAVGVDSSGGYQSAATLLHLVARLSVIMAYFFLCDRTSFFMKENRYFTPLNFWLPLAYIAVVGVFFSEQSSHTSVLNRDQTDEWKGWMQLVILVYHMTYASQMLSIYMHVRVLVSSYLFLTGYGHFMLFWTSGQLGVVRFAKVLFRLNMLTVLLCLIMNRPYQFYYFVPLVTFWYTALYVTLLLPPQVSAHSCQRDPAHRLYMALKLVAFFGGVVVLFTSEVLFERLFVLRPWRPLFVTEDDDIAQWWFRAQLDRFSMGYGMVFAFAHAQVRTYLAAPATASASASLIRHSSLASGWLLSGRRGGAVAAGAGGVLLLAVYSVFTLMCGTKWQCNAVHPYLVPLPIVGYIALRNAVPGLRARFSTLFAWFGRISLELFVGQYHVWLAANTYGVLVLVPLYPVLNVLLTSFVFVCVSLEVQRITAQLTAIFVPDDWRRCTRNLLIFLAILVAIGMRE